MQQHNQKKEKKQSWPKTHTTHNISETNKPNSQQQYIQQNKIKKKTTVEPDSLKQEAAPKKDMQEKLHAFTDTQCVHGDTEASE